MWLIPSSETLRLGNCLNEGLEVSIFFFPLLHSQPPHRIPMWYAGIEAAAFSWQVNSPSRMQLLLTLGHARLMSTSSGTCPHSKPCSGGQCSCSPEENHTGSCLRTLLPPSTYNIHPLPSTPCVPTGQRVLTHGSVASLPYLALGAFSTNTC